jgi:hypothetical protein
MGRQPSRYDLVYVHTDVPAGMTIHEWRTQRAARSVARRSGFRLRRSPQLSRHRLARLGSRWSRTPRQRRRAEREVTA